MNHPVSAERRGRCIFARGYNVLLQHNGNAGRVARSIKDIPRPPFVIPKTSIKEINPLLLFAGCRARARE